MRTKKAPKPWVYIIIVAAILAVFLIAFAITQSGREANVDNPATAESGERIGPTSTELSPPSYTDLYGNPLDPLPPMTEEDRGEDIQRPEDRDRYYINDRVLSCDYNDQGDKFYLGVDLGVDAHAATLYLNPRCTASMNGSDVAYLISASPYPPTQQYGGGDRSSQDHKIRDWYLDIIKPGKPPIITPACYQGAENCGVTWADERMAGPDEIAGDTTLYIQIFLHGSQRLIGTCKAEIDYDETEDTYHLASLVRTDNGATGYITKAEERELIDWAYDYTCSLRDTEIPPYIAEGFEGVGKEALAETAIVEYVKDRSYFPATETPEWGRVTQGELASRYSDLVAVTLHQGQSGGSITFYFSPDGPVNLEDYLAPEDEKKGEDEQTERTSFSTAALTSRNLRFVGHSGTQPII